MRKLKLLIGKPSDKLSRDLMASGKKKMQASDRVVNWPLHSEASTCISWASQKVPSGGNVNRRRNPHTIYS
jgi:hypothetical protein